MKELPVLMTKNLIFEMSVVLMSSGVVLTLIRYEIQFIMLHY